MALAAVQPAMNHEGNQSLHPFFSRPPRSHAPLEDLSTNETLANNCNEDDNEHAPTNAQPIKTRKKRSRKNEDVKEKKDGALHTKTQASLERFTQPAQTEHAEQLANNDFVSPALEEEPNAGRRKRMKTASPAAESSMSAAPGTALSVPLVEDSSEALLRATSPVLTSIGTEHIAMLEDISAAQDQVHIVTPKKQIRVTKSGRLVSSPPKPILEDSTTPKKRRGRKPAKAKVATTTTIIKYGTTAANKYAIGGRIDAILAGITSTSKNSTAGQREISKPVGPAKNTHPFFLGKASQKTEEAPAKSGHDQHPPTPRKSAVTPGKLRAETRRDYSPEAMSAFGTSSGSSRITKQAGLLEAAWPTRETSHVRNLGVDAVQDMDVGMTRSSPLHVRKLKNRVVTLDEDEEVVAKLARDIAADMALSCEESKLDFTAPEDVRLPKRLITTGIDIQRRLHGRLQTPLQWTDEKPSNSVKVHPAVNLLFKDIEHTLTPFDEGRCEGQTWAQKYSPKCASHVLSEDKDALVLRDWLQSLTVMAVGGAQSSFKTDNVDVKRPPKKKRKKAVDDFIVSDEDEDDEEMIEIADKDDAPHVKSLRRPQWTRNKNVVVLSGPHGCGKSATVYAVAKELDFEIFELNSGTRRSGKDIQDKVGDMTANHLVNHKRAEAATTEEGAAATDTDNDTERMDSALRLDIDSGRQGTMMNFFKSKPTTEPKLKSRPKTQASNSTPTHTQRSTQPKLNGPQKSQKQSLILFEEADILFEEDQQFWAQVTKLAAHSKRPIVITCNDERQIPLQDLPLAAVLRLRPPPADLATDYMLVLAGREGHILERQAIRSLYDSKNHDLRASIMELDMWCQMSVGDKKGGLEWIYQRWPPGKDVDAHGRLLRVASESTYQSGMGWLSHNIFETRSNTVFNKEEELLNEVWSDWGINPNTWVASSSHLVQSTEQRFPKDLEQLDEIMETLSAADNFCRVGLPSYESDFSEPADPTLPPISNKARLSHTLAAPLLQADQQTDFLQLDASIYTQIQLLSHHTFANMTDLFSASAGRTPLTEADYTNTILEIHNMKGRELSLQRSDFSYALDCLAAPPDQTLPERTSFVLTPSSFDRTFSIITLDLAPYVRSIVAHEQMLEAQRVCLSNFLSAGGNGKRARTTRASRVALEGGVRETKRRDRWFDAEVNFELVMATAGKGWTGMGWRNEDEEMNEGTASVTATQDSLTGSQDVAMHDTIEDTVVMPAE